MKYFWGSVISELRQKRRFERHFRSALNNGHRQQGSVGPVRANNGLMHCSKTLLFSASL
jgi:hypothetical protein